MAPWTVTPLGRGRRAAQLALFGVGLAGVVTLVADGTLPDLYTVGGLAFAGIGVLLTSRRPDNGIGWCFLGAWCLIGLFAYSSVAQQHAVSSGDFTSLFAWSGGWLVGWLWGPLLYLATALPLLLFPDGFSGPRGRAVAIIGAGAVAVSVVTEVVSPVLGYAPTGSEDDYILVANNPLSPGFLRDAGPADNWLVRNAALAVLVATTVVAGAMLVRRALTAAGVERLQFRWVIFAACIMVVTLVLTGLPFGPDEGSLISTLGWNIVLLALPSSMTVAVLRYRLYDIDRIISRTTSYAIVTGLVLVTYGVVVTAVTRLLPEASTLAVAAATLTAAAVVRPLLRRVRVAVDRRFDRTRYDAQLTLDSFGARLRNEVAVDRVRADLASVVTSSLQPAEVTLWLNER